ncbi:hypothetical protein KEU06_10635 [Pseudaminobacter sp. 19-2017]|uniref:Extracellular solute-binding protein n=1 Tax=Pseudaminobacter soli (ex Zhang et al. 2022) TaxID=2831468 RepID=A0A942DWX4_9HYPH|nr:hypothetical protein [Pseudaminobacter soli]MBS3649064.1 hypothetical protein [Pseudaminobacter soli]
MAGTLLSLSLGGTPQVKAHKFDWRQFEGQMINGLMNVGPLVDAYVLPQIAEFEELTGIKVQVEKLTDQQVHQKLDILLSGKDMYERGARLYRSWLSGGP